MPHLAKKTDCTGCMACANKCPVNAIEMQPDPMGFKYPSIDSDKCIECKLCEKSCPIVTPDTSVESSVRSTYAAQLSDKTNLCKSQSGGAFFGMAKSFINSGGIVYGASFDENLDVVHKRASDIDQLEELRMSKYVQCEIGDTVKNIIRDLDAGLPVLFSGTPCQVAGIKQGIPLIKQGQLYTVDFVCHGVPGPEVYRQYRSWLESKKGKRIIRFIFRDKSGHGWKTAREAAIYEDGSKESYYYYNFLFQAKDLLARKGCSSCRFCNLHRPSDITIGDCWGWEKLGMNNIDENLGISIMLVNSVKGEKILCKSEGEFRLIQVPLQPLMQQCLHAPTPRPKRADKVARDFAKHGFDYIHRHYGYTPANLRRYKAEYYLGRIIHRLRKLI